MWIVLLCLCVLFLSMAIWFLVPYSGLRADFVKDIKDIQTKEEKLYGEEVFSESDFEGQPEVIRRYLQNCGYLGKRKMNALRMEYRDVAFCQGRKGRSLKIDYTQYNDVRRPCRLAMIDSRLFGIPFQGYDSYRDGVGEMKGVLAKGITLFDQKGKDMDRAALVTFLAESLFVPSTLLQGYLQLEEMGDRQVKASITAYGETVGGIFTFNDAYEMVSFTTEDRAEVNAEGTVNHVPWSAICGEYRNSAEGIKVPTRFQAVWNEQEGDYVYFDGVIHAVHYE